MANAWRHGSVAKQVSTPASPGIIQIDFPALATVADRHRCRAQAAIVTPDSLPDGSDPCFVPELLRDTVRAICNSARLKAKWLKSLHCGQLHGRPELRRICPHRCHLLKGDHEWIHRPRNRLPPSGCTYFRRQPHCSAPRCLERSSFSAWASAT